MFTYGCPVLGICYGQMLMVHQLGGTAQSGHHREFGRAFVTVERPSALLDGVAAPGAQAEVWTCDLTADYVLINANYRT